MTDDIDETQVYAPLKKTEMVYNSSLVATWNSDNPGRRQVSVAGTQSWMRKLFRHGSVEEVCALRQEAALLRREQFVRNYGVLAQASICVLRESGLTAFIVIQFLIFGDTVWETWPKFSVLRVIICCGKVVRNNYLLQNQLQQGIEKFRNAIVSWKATKSRKSEILKYIWLNVSAYHNKSDNQNRKITTLHKPVSVSHKPPSSVAKISAERAFLFVPLRMMAL